MKSLVEYMTTMIITMILVFVFSGIINTGLQILNARTVFDEVFNKFEASYYQLNLNDVNEKMNNDWYFECKELDSVKTRKTYELTLYYTIKLPVLKSADIKANISECAR